MFFPPFKQPEILPSICPTENHVSEANNAFYQKPSMNLGYTALNKSK